MNNRVLKVVAALFALALVLVAGVILGGSIVYALTQFDHVTPVSLEAPAVAAPVEAQGVDPNAGIVIASVVPEGPAAGAGVVRGDILLEVDGEILERPRDLVRVLEGLDPGDEVELKVLHGDEQRTLTATLGDRDGQAYLGLSPCGGLPEATVVRAGVRGAVIIEVTPDSPAEQAGLYEGAVIVAVDGVEIDAENDLATLIASYDPGDTVTLAVESPVQEPREVTVELGQHPEKEGVAYLGVRFMPFPRLRMLEGEHNPFGESDLPPSTFPDGEVESGAVVRRVHPDSPAADAGLERGDIITSLDGEPVTNPRVLVETIAEREPGAEITLTVYRPDDESEREIEVRLGEHPEREGKAYLGIEIGSFFTIKRSPGDDEGPRRFEFYMQPFKRWPFGESLPDAPLPDLDELPQRFEFHWSPGENDAEGPGHLENSI